MELMTKQSFKQTEVGLIPEDWDSSPITKLTKEIFLGLTSKVDYVKNGGFPLIRASDIAKGKIDLSNVKFISPAQHKSLTKYRRAVKDNVLVSKSGSLGVCAIVETDIEFSIYESIIVMQVIDNKLSSAFLLWLLRYESTQQRILGEKVGSSVAHLNIEMFRKLEIPLPTLTEQKAIASALSDVDELISSLEKLISKKKDIKQGAMQELLTPPHKGGKRLSGFEGEWVEKTLGEIINLDKGQQLNRDTLLEDGDYPVINGGVEPSGYSEKWNRIENTITISEGGNSCGYVNLLKTKFWSGGHCYTLKLKTSEVNQQYLYLFLKYMENSIMALRVGSGLPNIQKGRLELFLCSIPNDVKEQKAIAQILSDMDAEISQLEAKKAKYQSIKQGMMQELLTGKTRLL